MLSYTKKKELYEFLSMIKSDYNKVKLFKIKHI